MESKRPDKITGYNHPTTLKYSRNNRYKTFTEGQKPKKKEKFNTTEVGNTYSSYKELDVETDIKCPTCNEKVVKRCECTYNDKTCKLGHIWYTDRDGKIKTGNPH